MGQQYYQHKIEKDGCHVLKERTTVKGISIGDEFTMQLKEVFTVLFFFKDKIFNHTPMIFGLSKKGETIMCSHDLVTITKKKEQQTIIKRTRRK